MCFLSGVDKYHMDLTMFRILYMIVSSYHNPDINSNVAMADLFLVVTEDLRLA